MTTTAFRSYVACAGIMCAQALIGAQAHAADAARLTQALEQTLSAPRIKAASTTPKAALVTHGNRLEQLLVATPEVVAGMREAILAAQDEILLQIYEWNSTDEAARSVMDALWRRTLSALEREAPLRPLHIRVVVSRTFWAENDNAQDDLTELIDYVAEHPRAAERIHVELASWRGSPLSILHSKVLICDARTAIVMTGNLNTHGGLYRDSFNMAARITGPIVDTLRADWASARRGASRDKVSDTQLGLVLRAPAPNMLALPQTPPHNLAAAVLTRDSDWRPWGRSDDNPQDQGVIALLDAADTCIRIINPSLGIAQVQRALERAILERGVEVFVILSHAMNRDRDRRFFGGDNTMHAHRMLEVLLAQGGPAAADKLHIAWGAQDGVRISPPHSSGNIHAKVTSIDDEALLVGSTNFNNLSWYNSRELSVALIGRDVACPFQHSVFRPLYGRAVPLSHTHLEPGQQQMSDIVYRYLISRSPIPVP